MAPSFQKTNIQKALADSRNATPGTVPLAVWVSPDYRDDVARLTARFGRVGNADQRRACSEATVTTRRKVLICVMKRLSKHCRGIRTLSQLRPRLIPTLIRLWNEEGMAPRTQVQQYSVLRWFWRLHGIQVPSCIKAHVEDGDRYIVRAAAQQDRSASARTDPFRLFAWADEHDLRVGLYMRLAWALGLRRLECLRLQPHEDFDGTCLKIRRGSKGGRPRDIEFADISERRAEVARAALMRLRELTEVGGHAGWPDLTLQQAGRRLGWILQRIGLTKAALGATFHGLRHDFSIDELERTSGITAPVRGGLVNDFAALREHRQRVSQLLGHNRTKVTSAYYGSLRETTKLRIERVMRSARLLEPALMDCVPMLEQAGIEQVFMGGLRGVGMDSEADAPFELVLPGAGLEEPRRVSFQLVLQARLAAALPVPVVVRLSYGTLSELQSDKYLCPLLSRRPPSA